ncbi:MAG: hypothetical protein ACO1NZ_15640 [Adhaeribacter sp.]
MNNDRFKDRMKKLEQERDEFVEKLTAEGQQEYQQKKDEYNQTRSSGQEGTSNQDQQR